MPAELQKIRVAHVITGLGVGGAEMMLVKLIAGRDRGRFESRVIALSNDLPLEDRARQAGAEVSTLGLDPSLLAAAGGLRRLLRMLRDPRPDIVQTWLYHADLLGGVAGKLLGVPVIWNIQNSAMDPSRTSWRSTAVGRMGAAASSVVPKSIVACSYVGMNQHIEMGYDRRRFQVIPNGVDLSLFRPDPELRASVRAELGVTPDTQLIGMIARLHPQKDHENFFAAAGRVAKTHPNVRFVMVGLGLEPMNDETMAMVRGAGVEQQTILLGLRSDIPRILCGLDLHTLSSAFGEGFPNVLVEAMAVGVPCVVTDVGDSARIVGDTGRSVPSRDPGALASALREMLDLPAAEFDALRLRARERTASHFSIEAAVEQYEQLYERTALQQAQIHP
jgi:glycosyltransferase involved in cell wall biosynthesis